MKHGSLFSGIGGFDLAAQWAGWTNVFHCEINPFGRKVLNYYWPNAITYEDITKTDFTVHNGSIDIITGGFPCQPFSMAGKRKGTEDARHLWPEMLRAIREVKPRWIVGENVPGIINWSDGLVFEQVQADLENEGYEVQAFVLPACGVNAPHRRDRVWVVAHSINDRHNAGRSEASKKNGIQEKCGEEMDTRKFNRTSILFAKTPQNSIGSGCLQRELDQKRTEIWEQRNACTGNSDGVCLSERDASNPEITGHERTNATGATPTGGRFMQYPEFDRFPTQPPVCGRNDGLSSKLDGITFSKHRNESIKAYGNAIVPQVAYQIFKAINEFNAIQ